jgi:murein DD-endopeptidase MepM/ murein hydrolase activator NlpD
MPEGNHLIVQIAPERYVMLAHLQQHSLRVREGQRVAAGELLALCGNSGNTTAPHLHLQVQTRADP